MRVRNDHSPCLSSLNLEAKWGATSHQGPGGPCRLPAAPLAYEGQALPLTRPRLGRRPSLLLEPGEPSPAPRALPSLPWGRNHGMHCRGHAAESVLRQLIARGVHSQRAPASPRASGASPAGPGAGTWPHSTPHSQPLTHVWSQLRSVPPREDSGPSPRGVGPTHRPRPLPPRDSGTPQPGSPQLRASPSGSRRHPCRGVALRPGELAPTAPGLPGATASAVRRDSLVSTGHRAGDRRASGFPGDRRPAHAPVALGPRQSRAWTRPDPPPGVRVGVVHAPL